VGRQEQTVIHLVKHDIQSPQQEDTVEFKVFNTCNHQEVFELFPQERWRCQDRDIRLTQLKETLFTITAALAAQIRRTTRETLYRHGRRISSRVEEQMGPMLTDIAKETKPTTQQPLQRGQKRKVETSDGVTYDNLNRYHNEETNEEREDELRQGQRVYNIQGTRQVGYLLNIQSTHMTGAGTIQMTEQEKT
jgi:hypothetical protein